MDIFKKHFFEVIACIWLVLVGLQYISTYYLNLGVNFMPAYAGMLGVCVGIGGWRGFKALQPYLNGQQEKTTELASKSKSARNSGRSRR